MAPLLNDDIVNQIREVFEQMDKPVHIFFFGAKENCQYCEDTRQLLEEVSAITDKLTMSAHDVQEDADLARQHNADKAPTTIIAAKDGDEITDYGIRYAGIPSGHEFTSFIQDILFISARDSGLMPQTREYLATLKEPVFMQIFVTPTCPYCPRAVNMAHRMAFESPMVQAEMVEAMEFQELANRYNVSGVPHTVVNDGAANIIGAVPEQNFLSEIQRVMG
jgi:glutaredoxin-like protein